MIYYGRTPCHWGITPMTARAMSGSSAPAMLRRMVNGPKPKGWSDSRWNPTLMPINIPTVMAPITMTEH